jgi:hypothetical protein
MNENVFDQIAVKIIKEQELVIGPIAWIEAKKVKGLEIQDNNVHVLGQTRPVLEALVSRYARLFGDASIEVCKDAARPFIGKFPKTELPASLQ